MEFVAHKQRNLSLTRKTSVTCAQAKELKPNENSISCRYKQNLSLMRKNKSFSHSNEKLSLTRKRKQCFLCKKNKNLSFTREKKQHFLCKQTETWASQGGEKHHFLCTDKNFRLMRKDIFHKDREISILTMKKKTERLTVPQEATKRTKQGETKKQTKNEKHTPAWTKSASLTAVRGPSTVVCMIVT